MHLQRIPLDAECELLVWRNWLDQGAAHSAWAALTTELDWEQRSVRLFGRWVPQPRLISWAGALPYRYSGLLLEVRPAHALVHSLLQKVHEQTTVAFNHVLLNRYRNGDDSMGWHSDDETELGEDPPIASVSLGATRDFLLRPKAERRRKSRAVSQSPVVVELRCGDLLLMGGATQRRFVHALPKRAKEKAERISLTFRRVLAAPSA